MKKEEIEKLTVEINGNYIIIKVKNIFVQIKADDEGIVIDMYGPDLDESLASTYLMYSEAEAAN